MKEDFEKKLRSVFKRVFGLDSIDDAVSVVTVDAWDSLMHTTLILELENEFGVQITTSEAIDMTSVPEIRTILSRRVGIKGGATDATRIG